MFVKAFLSQRKEVTEKLFTHSCALAAQQIRIFSEVAFQFCFYKSFMEDSNILCLDSECFAYWAIESALPAYSKQIKQLCNRHHILSPRLFIEKAIKRSSNWVLNKEFVTIQTNKKCHGVCLYKSPSKYFRRETFSCPKIVTYPEWSN